jgi:hypothetical protein
MSVRHPEGLENRHPDTQEKMRWFTFEHLPMGMPREVSKMCATLAWTLVQSLDDGPQLVLALGRLCDTKDAAVRQALVDGGVVQ